MFSFKKVNPGNTNVIGLTDELKSIYINNIFESNDSNVLVVTSSLYEANKIYNNISTYNKNVLLYPMDNFIASKEAIKSPELEINRLETLNEIVSGNKHIVITNLTGLLSFLPTKKKYLEKTINLKVDMEISKDKLFEDLCNNGYKNETLVTKNGEISNRGFILDIFPINEENAVRIEFFGDTIESIRYFDVNTQLSIKKIDNIVITPFCESSDNDEISKLTDYLSNPIMVYIEYSQIYNSFLLLNDEINEYKNQIGNDEKIMFDLGDFNEKCGIFISSVDDILPNLDINETHKYISYDAMSFNDNIEELNNYLIENIQLHKTVVICMDNNQQMKNVINELTVSYVRSSFTSIEENRVNIIIYPITNGFVFDNYIFLASSNIFKNLIKKSLYKSKFKIGTKIKNIDSLNIGDYVVHNVVGIGLYEGIVTLKKNDISKDYLKIKYRDDGKLYIPVEKIELITKYSSSNDKTPILSKLGGSDWQKTKNRIREKMRFIAEDLLKVAAERKSKQGYKFPSDSALQSVFESEFEYEETPDQLKASQYIKESMEKSNPMDVLLCGDVGYGKTEVAFRAMFKAVEAGKQVAYLCPTTILSNQQYTAALSRFKNYPINIALLNRFTSKKDQGSIINKLKNGGIDILFGTHRILSDDIYFKDLGLLLIDEEQRFGVLHKEKLKKYKSNIDVLTLSATPIPRTLQMSMVGLRDLALIETPPNNRYPVQTYVLEENDLVIKDSIYKELSRRGQVYILCNNIDSFEKIINKLNKMIPEIKIGYAHGRMDKYEIEDVMDKFINREYDVLLCTTIIETGIDIPNVNTLIILDADKFGLSQLYQIKGRVGRTNKVAYAYLMYEKHKVLSDTARKRLEAIKDFAQLGSGYLIAKRDLSIRGAGDILGQEQSGFIDAIGIDLYLEMLNEEVEKINNTYVEEKKPDNNADNISLNVNTHISDSYELNDKLKIEIHRIINSINSLDRLEEVKKEIEDRFGTVDDDILIYMYEELFENTKEENGIEKVIQTNKFIQLYFNSKKTQEIDMGNLFINAYKISKNFKISHNKRLVITLNLFNLDKHWLLYIIDLLNIMK